MVLRLLGRGRRAAHRGVACCAAEGTTLAQTGLATLAGSRWVGAGELWLDPLGDEAREYDCTRRSATDRCAIPGRTKARRTKASSPFAADGQVGPTAGISRPPSSAPSYPRCQDCSRSTMPTRHPAARTGTGARPCPRAEWRVGAADDERRALGRGAARRAHGVHAQVLSIATISSRRLPPSRILRLRRVPLARPRARAGFRRTKFPSSPLARRIRSGRMPR